MKPKQIAMYAVYLLHFDAPVGKTQHYVGVCKAARLHQRQQEHARAVGASLTARAVRQGTGWHVAAVMWCSDPAYEREVKARGHFDKLCPICNASRSCCVQPVGLAHYDPNPTKQGFSAVSIETQPNRGRYQP